MKQKSLRSSERREKGKIHMAKGQKKRKKAKAQVKWHRVGFFQNEKKPDGKKEHPAFVFSRSKQYYKAVIFTRHPTTNGKDNLPLLHNVDPAKDMENQRKPPKEREISYGVPYRGPRKISEFQSPKTNYRIHIDDKDNLALLKAGKNKK